MSRTVAVVGAGLAGVTAAGALAARGFAVTVFDKSPRVGGRMATRRLEVPGLGTATFDHGAPRWDGDPDATLGLEPWFDQAYRSPGGMRAAVERLAGDLLLSLGTRVESVRRVGGCWELVTAGHTSTADWLVLTPPLPQALDLLDNDTRSDLPTGLGDITYSRCVTLLAAGRGVTRLPACGGIWFDGEPLRAVVDNHAKGVSAVGPAVTIHAAPEASHTLAVWDETDEIVTARLLEWARPWVELDAPTTHIHRWRYNRPLTTWPEPCYADPSRRLVLAGDAFGGPGLGGVYRSGQAAAGAVS